jgi:hypothetical protein
MKRRLFTGVAAAAALAATLMIGNVGQAAAADPPAEAASATTAQKTGVTPNSRIPGTSPVRVDEAKFKTVETLRGIGKQVYECTNGTYALREPVAGLITLRGIPAGIHGKGPFWALFDGSKVSKPAASTAASDSALSGASNVPWLLVPVAPEGTGGSLSSVQLVQRIDTRGGVAPATCVGRPQTLTVDYSANYVFWAPK